MAKKSVVKIVTAEMRAVIAEAVEAGRQASQIQVERSAFDPYKSVEKRLYAYPILKEKVEADKESLERMRTEGSPERSRGIVRYSRPGYRLPPEEMLEALLTEEAARIAVDVHELEAVETAIATVENDSYYKIIPKWYFEGLTKEVISKQMNFDSTTIWRHRKRLINRIAIRLYGAIALK